MKQDKMHKTRKIIYLVTILILMIISAISGFVIAAHAPKHVITMTGIGYAAHMFSWFISGVWCNVFLVSLIESKSKN